MQCRRSRFDPCFLKILWRRKWQPTLVFLPGESHAQRSLAGYSPWGCKSQTRLSDSITPIQSTEISLTITSSRKGPARSYDKEYHSFRASEFIPGKFHGQRSLAGYSPWGCKESDTTSYWTYTSFILLPSIISLSWTPSVIHSTGNARN